MRTFVSYINAPAYKLWKNFNSTLLNLINLKPKFVDTNNVSGLVHIEWSNVLTNVYLKIIF